jgi:hypothetical protein
VAELPGFAGYRSSNGVAANLFTLSKITVTLKGVIWVRLTQTTT